MKISQEDKEIKIDRNITDITQFKSAIASNIRNC